MQLQRRQALKLLAGLTLAPAAFALTGNKHDPIPLQEAPVQGFQFYQGEQAWPFMKQEHLLKLKREKHNSYDPNAVAVYWRGHKLGYLPRGENQVAAHLLDHGQKVSARVSRLHDTPNPTNRVWVEVLLEAA